MSERLRVAIVGGSGYVGGELLRLLLGHPNIEVTAVTSERFAGTFVRQIHPHLRGRTLLKFVSQEELETYDVLFLCTPHGTSQRDIDRYDQMAGRIIDLSADFRLSDAAAYEQWYVHAHLRPELLSSFVYGIPELHRERMRSAKKVSSAGCNATATILALHPLVSVGLIDPERVTVEVKVGSSEAGAKATASSHYSERANVVRSFKPTGHRHTAEIEQELGLKDVAFSATSIGLVRGVLATCHAYLKDETSLRDLLKAYRQVYADSPFVRLVTERTGNYRYPEPKLLWGTNYCDIGLELDERSGRVVVISAIDNLVKGAAGQAIQALNIMHGYDETLGLEFAGMHPI